MTGRRIATALRSAGGNAHLYASAVVAAVGGWAAVEATSFRGSAQAFPRTVALVVCGLGVLGVLVELRRALWGNPPGERDARPASDTPGPDEPQSSVTQIAVAEMDPVGEAGVEEDFRLRRALYYFCWVIGYIAVIYVGGFLLGTVLFLAAYFLFQQRTSKRFALISVAATALFLVGLDQLVDFGWPTGLLGW